MDKKAHFEFRLTGSGWARGRIAIGEQSAEVTASYLGDALADLLEAVLELCEGATESRASWAEEPGEYRWVFERLPFGVRVRLLDFPHMPSDAPDKDGRLLFDEDCSLWQLASAVAAGARRTLEEHGVEGYEAEWLANPFPGEELALVEQWVGRHPDGSSTLDDSAPGAGGSPP